jgi:RimJ/RimL family protein N-acetyltransferase
MTEPIELRPVRDEDLPVFHQHHVDVESRHMAAFVAAQAPDLASFVARFKSHLENPTNVARTIVVAGRVAGHVLTWESEPGRPEVTYWIGREFFGRGVASRALELFLRHEQPIRPIHGRCADGNPASLRVLEKCGFVRVGEARDFAPGRGAEITEFVLRLDS